mmetsp:Transcript_22905/g.52570  ORF Transcript_22905/g.52570 Transcript_22905/m.52570 type:complete len:208 (+) Transcript_22905:296-919(+)
MLRPCHGPSPGRNFSAGLSRASRRSRCRRGWPAWHSSRQPGSRRSWRLSRRHNSKTAWSFTSRFSWRLPGRDHIVSVRAVQGVGPLAEATGKLESTQQSDERGWRTAYPRTSESFKGEFGHPLGNFHGHRSHELEYRRQLEVGARLGKVLKPCYHVWQQTQLPSEEGSHVKMTVGPQYLTRRNTALVHAFVEVKHHSSSGISPTPSL